MNTCGAMSVAQCLCVNTQDVLLYVESWKRLGGWEHTHTHTHAHRHTRKCVLQSM